MTRTLTIPRNERGVVRLFALSMSDTEAEAMKADPNAIAAALGTDEPLATDHIELFPVSDLEGVGLYAYLEDGAGLPTEQLARDRSKIEKLGGWVLIVYSLAFGDREMVLRPAPALTLIGRYGEERTDWQAGPEPLTSDSATSPAGTPGTGKKSDAAMSGRVAMLVLLGLAIFTYVFIRMAG